MATTIVVVSFFHFSSYNIAMEEVKEAVIKFAKDWDWDQFHSPANLAKSIAIESGELLECFQWDDNYDKQKVCEELADVVNYAILLADKLNVKLEDIVMAKLLTRVRVCCNTTQTPKENN